MSGAAAFGQIYFGQYSSGGSVPIAIPSHVSCWALVGATTQVWGGSDTGVQEQWAVLTPNSYNEYCLGENFTIIANEEFPMFADETEPLIVPPDSGYTSP